MRLIQFFLLIFVLHTTSGFAQKSWDYQAYPPQQVNFTQADINLTISPEQSRVGGVVTYQANALRDGIGNVVLHGAELSIDAITVNGETAVFEVKGDSIDVQVSDTLAKGQEVTIAVTWQSTSGFGFHSESDSLIWSSLQPKAVRHWLPVFDHPRNELEVSMEITVPKGYTAVGTGTLQRDEVIVGEGLQTFSWRSSVPVPASAISWAAGNFDIIEAPFETKKIRLFVPAGVNIDTASVLGQSMDIIRSTALKLKNPYPSESLNIVVLKRTFGEIRNYAASTVYVFDEEDSGVTSQLARGIAAQWFGIRVIQEQYKDQENISSLLQALVTRDQVNIELEPGKIELSTELPGVFQLNSTYNAWMQSDLNKKDSLFYAEMMELLPGFYSRFEGIAYWNKFSDLIYNRTGLPYLQVPAPPGEAADTAKTQQPKFSYDVTYMPGETQGKLNLVFEAGGQSDLEIETGTLKLVSFSDSTSKEVSFTGQVDTVSVSIEPATEWAYFSIPDSHVVIKEYKPIMFWLGQLRQGNAELRVKAAAGLRSHADNPDLQLALLDVLASENDTKVKAALLRTLSQITSGATGTEQRFLEELSSDLNPVKLEAIRALRVYEGNPEVIQALRSRVLRTASDTVFKASVQSLIRVADTTLVSETLRRIMEVRGIDERTIFMAEQVIAFMPAEEIIHRFDEALPSTHSVYAISRSLKLLRSIDQDTQNWRLRLDLLAESADPRIRYLASRYTPLLTAEDREAWVSDLLLEEEDYRVRQAVSEE